MERSSNGRYAAEAVFDHFQDTGFIVEENGAMLGFLIGFLSQSRNEAAYIHLLASILRIGSVASDVSFTKRILMK
ncbi:hypothetical protein [Paenibacillus glucanolyticus]|uniref:hypothetical protein n=1 Tax=Paenibacillus glucanolyticus TaxID=59843 RepID=UPI0034CF6C00